MPGSLFRSSIVLHFPQKKSITVPTESSHRNCQKATACAFENPPTTFPNKKKNRELLTYWEGQRCDLVNHGVSPRAGCEWPERAVFPSKPQQRLYLHGKRAGSTVLHDVAIKTENVHAIHGRASLLNIVARLHNRPAANQGSRFAAPKIASPLPHLRAR